MTKYTSEEIEANTIILVLKLNNKLTSLKLKEGDQI